MGPENRGLGKKTNSCVRALLMSLSQVFDLSSTDGSGVIISDSQIEFLDEFRIVVAHASRATVLFMFNTPVPQTIQGTFGGSDSHGSTQSVIGHRGQWIEMNHLLLTQPKTSLSWIPKTLTDRFS